MERIDITDKVALYNCDCMEYMKDIPDKYYDLAIVDPPYGIDITSSGRLGKYNSSNTTWDKHIPDTRYFEELFRISKNQIIWGGNYFLDYLGATKCFLIYDKKQPPDISFASCEFAWTSFNSVAKTFYFSPMQMKDRLHPAQKPVKLYEWLLKNYAKPTDKIIDTHFGSCSIGIACHNFGCSLDACEIDKEYFDKAVERLKMHVAQLELFKD